MVGLNGFTPIGLDRPFWKVVSKLYLQDRLEEAYAEALKLNTNDNPSLMRLLGPEYLTRLGSHRMQVRKGLELEYVPGEIHPAIDELAQTVRTNCEVVATAFEWDWHEKTLVTILAAEADADVLRHDWGYFVDKYPYDKICLPFRGLALEEWLPGVIRHEFAHVVTTNQSGGYEPTWLSEGLSMLADGGIEFRSWAGFQANRYEWRDPNMLTAQIRGDRLNPTKLPLVNVGYAQASYVVMYLRKIGGSDIAVRLLKQLADQSFGINLKRGLLGRSHVDDALRHVLGISETQLFQDALNWVRATSSLGVASLGHL